MELKTMFIVLYLTLLAVAAIIFITWKFLDWWYATGYPMTVGISIFIFVIMNILVLFLYYFQEWL